MTNRLLDIAVRGARQLRLNTADRRVLVAALRRDGKSARYIARALAVMQVTIRRDLNALGLPTGRLNNKKA